jgi:collagen type III alpha/collagen type V/XI/XXIV/XXVII alpha
VPSEEPESKERTEVEHAYSHADLKKLNVGCDAVPAGVDVTMFEEADLRKVEQVKREAAEKKKKEKAEKEAAEKEKKEKAKAEKEAAEKEKKEKANADKAAKESARERVAKSKSTDAPALGGALGLGFLGINNSSSSLASQGESTKEGEKKDEGGTQAAKGMSVKDLAAALMAELRGLEDRVEVLGEEEGAMVALKLGAALEAVRQEPFKSI